MPKLIIKREVIWAGLMTLFMLIIMSGVFNSFRDLPWVFAGVVVGCLVTDEIFAHPGRSCPHCAMLLKTSAGAMGDPRERPNCTTCTSWGMA